MREPTILNKIFRNSLGYVVAIGSVALATWLKFLAQPNIIPAERANSVFGRDCSDRHFIWIRPLLISLCT